MRTLIDWLVGCWACEACTPFLLLVNVVSCVLRTAIIVILIIVVAKYAPGIVNEMVDTVGLAR